MDRFVPPAGGEVAGGSSKVAEEIERKRWTTQKKITAQKKERERKREVAKSHATAGEVEEIKETEEGPFDLVLPRNRKECWILDGWFGASRAGEQSKKNGTLVTGHPVPPPR